MTRVIGLIILYVVCFAIIVVSVFCGIQLYKEVKAESYVNGSININNQFSQESFNYSSTSVVFYDVSGTVDEFSFEKDLLKVDDFNGEEKTYQVVLNDCVLLNADIKAGSVFAKVNIDFYDVNGDVINSAEMNLSIKFLSDRTQLYLYTKGNASKQFLEQYFTDNGIRLRVLEIKKQGGSVQ